MRTIVDKAVIAALAASTMVFGSTEGLKLTAERLGLDSDTVWRNHIATSTMVSQQDEGVYEVSVPKATQGDIEDYIFTNGATYLEFYRPITKLSARNQMEYKVGDVILFNGLDELWDAWTNFRMLGNGILFNHHISSILSSGRPVNAKWIGAKVLKWIPEVNQLENLKGIPDIYLRPRTLSIAELLAHAKPMAGPPAKREHNH